jgi:hypothetical protein
VDFCTVPYPHKRVHWDRLVDKKLENPEAHAYDYGWGYWPGEESKPPRQVRLIGASGFGLVLWKRRVATILRSHCEEIEPNLVWDDGDRALHAVFNPLVTNIPPRGGPPPWGKRWYLSEDYACCYRWTKWTDGGGVWQYLGPGSPAIHVGECVFHGQPEAFGIKR